jgi:hypothetical protein
VTALQTLRALASAAPSFTGILGACRLESGNVDAFGIEAVTDAFRSAPMADAETALAIEAPGHLAIFGEHEAIIADLYGDNIGRLWRMGQVDAGVPEPAVSVAFDTDLKQARADVFASAAEHPALSPDAIERVMTLGRTLVHDTSVEFATFRARAFALRAFGSQAHGCVLFAVHSLAPNPTRTPHLGFAAARWDGAATQIVRDLVSPRIEHVRIVT